MFNIHGELTRRYAADARVNLMQGDEGRIRSSAGGRAARGLSGRNTQRTELWLPYKARVAFALLGGSSSSRAARLCVCCFLFLTMDRALFISDKSKPKLDSGVADKLREAARLQGDVSVPTATGAVVGAQFRGLADKAMLEENEALALMFWLEEVYGKEAADRYLKPLPTFHQVNVAPPPPAPGSNAPQPVVAPTAAANAPISQTFAQLMANANAPAVAPIGNVMQAPTAPDMYVSPQEREDEAAHGMNAGMIAVLTFLVHTSRLPPVGDAQVKYGVDPSSMQKLYRGMKESVGTLLWDLVKSETSTMKEFQDHFHRATQAAAGSWPIQQRISSHWMEMMQYFDTVGMVRAYYRKFLTIRSGRGLPKLIDEHIVMLVMCAELERTRTASSGGGANSAEVAALAAAVEKSTRVVEAGKETISDLKAKMGEIKNDLNNLKSEVKAVKEKSSSAKSAGAADRKCDYCGQTGHVAQYCHKRIGEEAVKKAQLE